METRPHERLAKREDRSPREGRFPPAAAVFLSEGHKLPTLSLLHLLHVYLLLVYLCISLFPNFTILLHDQ